MHFLDDGCLANVCTSREAGQDVDGRFPAFYVGVLLQAARGGGGGKEVASVGGGAGATAAVVNNAERGQQERTLHTVVLLEKPSGMTWVSRCHGSGANMMCVVT